MTDEHINAEVAKICGWADNFCSDLNAMRKAEKILTLDQQYDYSVELLQLTVFTLSPNQDIRGYFNIAHASARQRAIAFLQVDFSKIIEKNEYFHLLPKGTAV